MDLGKKAYIQKTELIRWGRGSGSPAQRLAGDKWG